MKKKQRSIVYPMTVHHGVQLPRNKILRITQWSNWGKLFEETTTWVSLPMSLVGLGLAFILGLISAKIFY